MKPAGGSSRRSAFMAAVGQERPPVPVHRKRFLDDDKKEGAAELEPLVDQNGEYEHNEDPKDMNPVQNGNERIEFHSEYQKNFRPFSQYDYIAGKFLVKNQGVTSASNLSGESWYAEVIEMRKKAGEYRHRGWGTELVPQHLAEVYNKQIALWEHVSRRSSLSALTLATTTQRPRALTKEEKSKENNRKSKLHEARQTSVDRASSLARKKTDKNGEIKRHSAKLQKDSNGKQDYSETTSAPDSSSGRTRAGSLSGSPKKAASKANSSSSPKKTNSTMSTVGPHEPRARPTTLATNAHPRTKRDTSISTRKQESLKSKVSPAMIKVNEPRRHSTSKSSVNDTPNVDKTAEPYIVEIERIVKSPPEPTRVKSPEQIMIKSPGPVNWTVPLDTGKTFTVTQNIPNDTDYHYCPPSEVILPHHGCTHVAFNVDSSSSKKIDDAVIPTPSCDQPSIKSSDIEPSQLGTSHLNGIVNPPNTIPSSLDSISENEPNSPTSIPSRDTKVVKPSEISEDSIVVVDSTETSPSTAVLIADCFSSNNVLDSSENRFYEFWNKPTLNGKESSM